ncbi:hypothetical protein KP509_22G058700 [Ceratopteris richardii]|uniref:Aminotransferase class I/classII large domain-containing protein n=1 Tax=Ceratopteris richardii TaxID=49495 RepID=A0A8T2S8H6_CERRI|nr:hypothetical protein KP509_22G058700 [Ceratopteris richardii]
MFSPYYFNAYMSFQMTGVTDILVGPTDPETLQPDTEWLENVLFPKDGSKTPKLVTVVNPGNPSGMYIPKHLLERISALCSRAGAWFLVDNTYEYFMFDGREHSCIEGDHILNIFSFSKAYGMMGWRIGYIAYPSTVEGLGDQLLKIQDNIPICPSIIGQKLALFSMEVGSDWVRRNVTKLSQNISIIKEALTPLEQGSVKGGEGAIYLWVKLPEKAKDDVAVVEWLAKKHGVMVIPGSASGGPGYIRISFGGLPEDRCRLAAARLRKGLEQLVNEGLVH